MTSNEAKAELHELMYGKNRWWYAWAMGSGCAMENGNDEIMNAIRQRDKYLREKIAGG